MDDLVVYLHLMPRPINCERTYNQMDGMVRTCWSGALLVTTRMK